MTAQPPSPALPALLLAAALCATPAAQGATLYKYKDANGNIQFTDRPPPQVETEKMTVSTTTSKRIPSYATREAARKNPVTLYSPAPDQPCTPCDEARKLLTDRGIPFTEKRVTTEQELEEYKKATGVTEGSYPSVVIGSIIQKGFSASQWHSALDTAGYPKEAQKF